MMKVQISILTTGSVRKELALKLIKWLKETSHDVLIDFTEERPISHCRNLIVKKFLESRNEWLLMIDEDVVPSKNPLNLLKYNKDIIACPCPIFQGKIVWNCYNLDNDGYWIPIHILNKKNLIEIDATGTGCILIKRKVLKNIKKPFERIFDAEGIEKLGLDLSFSKKAKEKGFKIFVAPEYHCSHFKNINLVICL